MNELFESSYLSIMSQENDRLRKEIERLNNIINGMVNFFEYEYDNEVRALNDRKISVWTICLDKLNELKKENDRK